jgi:hypothetical protein
VAGEKVFRLKLWPDELKQATLPPETFPPIRYTYRYLIGHKQNFKFCARSYVRQNYVSLAHVRSI